MEKLQLKTNINCGGCIGKVTPHLNAEQRIREWSVDTTDARKLLTVVTDNMSMEEITDAES